MIEVLDSALSVAVVFGTLATAGWTYFKFRTKKLLTWDDLVPDWESRNVIGQSKNSRSRHIPGPHVIVEVGNSAESLRRAIEEATGSNQTVEDGKGTAKEAELKAEIRIPKASVGLFIGKSGSNIKQIKKDSDAAIYLNDHGEICNYFHLVYPRTLNSFYGHCFNLQCLIMATEFV